MVDMNPLGIYSPITTEQVKALSEMRHPNSGGSSYPVYSDWASWDRARYGTGTAIDYRQKLGDLTQNSLVMAGITWLGNTLPEAPILVKQTTGRKGESEVVAQHKMASLLKRPNPFFSGSNLWKGFALSWLLSGNVYFLKMLNDYRQVVELWYVPHWLMTPRWPAGDKSVFISHYDYDIDGKIYQIDPRRVIHFRDGVDPLNPRCGLSRLGALLRELYGDGEAASYSALLLGGSGVPPFIIGIDPTLEMEQKDLDEIRDRAHRSTTGAERGKPFVVQGGKVYQLAFNPKDMNLAELHDFPESRFCAVTGIPAVVLELASGMKHSIYNNVKQAMERAYQNYLKPLQAHVAEELTHQLLLPDFEDNDESFYVQHDYSKVQALQEDESAKAARLTMLYEKGGIMRSELRSGMNYGPSDEANPDADKVFATSAKVEAEPDDLESEEEVKRLAETNGHKAASPVEAGGVAA